MVAIASRCSALKLAATLGVEAPEIMIEKSPVRGVPGFRAPRLAGGFRGRTGAGHCRLIGRLIEGGDRGVRHVVAP